MTPRHARDKFSTSGVYYQEDWLDARLVVSGVEP